MEQTQEVENAHDMPVRDVVFAEPRQNQLATCGDDCAVKLWDIRQLKDPTCLLELTGHSHWVWKCDINPFHNQLLLSSSSDSLVILWSAQPLGGGLEGSPQKSSPKSIPVDRNVHTYSDHEDSVYGLSWSRVDPWVFASVSYDGRVVINKVPSEIKYKILI